MRDDDIRPPGRWGETRWTIDTANPVRFTLTLPGTKALSIDQQDDGSWAYMINDSSPHYYGPFATADAAAKAAEETLRQQISAAMALIHEMRR